MHNSEILGAVAQQLRELFKDKAELRGVGDWDAFIGCLITLDRVIADLRSQVEFEEEPAVEVTEDG